MDPVDILTPQLWGVVFAKVEDPQDWLNLYRASSSFGNIVGSDRVQSLLPEVLSLVRKYLDKGLQDLLPLRLVSKCWKKAVDKAWEPASYKKTDEFVLEHINSMGPTGPYMFPDSARISKFLDKLGTHPGNPFIGNFVIIFFNLDNGRPWIIQYRHSLQRLMEKFGRHISKLWINCDTGVGAYMADLILEIENCLNLIPNLEELSVRFAGTRNAAYGLDSVSIRTPERPILQTLKCFQFNGRGNPKMLVDLQNILVRLCCNPETLRAAKLIGVPYEFSNYSKLETCFVGITRPSEDTFRMTRVSWPLTKLALYAREGIPLALDVVVRSAEHFKNSLISLRIGSLISGTQALEPRHLELSMDLPRLEYLFMRRELLFRNFVSKLPSLKKLHVIDWVVFPEEDYVQKVANLKSQMAECNIWEALPKLRRIEVIGWRPISSAKIIPQVYIREKK